MGNMPQDSQLILDSTDDAMLLHLQRDGRISVAELARAVSMSPSSVADRLRRLSDHGVIQGYTVVVSAAARGYPLTAFIRVRLSVAAGKSFHAFLDNTPQVLEAHHITGDDCFLLKVIATSMDDLEALANEVASFGHAVTNLVFSSPAHHRPVPPLRPSQSVDPPADSVAVGAK